MVEPGFLSSAWLNGRDVPCRGEACPLMRALEARSTQDGCAPLATLLSNESRNARILRAPADLHLKHAGCVRSAGCAAVERLTERTRPACSCGSPFEARRMRALR